MWRHAGFWFCVSWLLAWVLPSQFPGFCDFVLQTVVRDFERLGLAALIALCLLTGLGFAACTAAARSGIRPSLRRLVAPVFVVLVVAGRLASVGWPFGEYPIEPAPTAGVEGAILRAGSGPVLVLPIGDPRKDSGSHATAMYRSIAHWRPLLNGYCSYYPRGFRERMDLARRLPDPNVLDTLRRDTHLTTIVVESGSFPAFTIGRWRTAIAKGTLPGVRIEHGDVLVLAIEQQGW